MSAGEFIFARLSGATSAESRVYPLLLPDAPTFPALTYHEVSAVRTHAMGQDAGLLRVRVQLNAWGDTYAAARALGNEVAARLSRFRGTASGQTVLDVLLDNEMMTYDSETNSRRVIQEYTLFLTTNE